MLLTCTVHFYLYCPRFRDARGLLFLLSHQLEELQSSHHKLVTALNSLDGAPANQEIINKSVECCLRPTGPKLLDCMFCKADELFDDYEGKLYCFVDKGVESNFSEEGLLEGNGINEADFFQVFVFSMNDTRQNKVYVSQLN